MSPVSIHIETSGLKAFTQKLTDIEARIPRAVAFGLNEGGDKVRTQVQRGLQRQTGLVAYRSVLQRTSTMRAFGTNAPKTGIGPTQPSGLNYQIVVRGKPTKIYEYKYGVKAGPGGYVWAKLWGVQHVFARSFQIKWRAGASGLRMRIKEDRLPLRGFDGANLAKELGEGNVPGIFYATTASFVPGAIIKHLSKVL